MVTTVSASYEVTEHSAAPPEKVFDLLADGAGWSAWAGPMVIRSWWERQGRAGAGGGGGDRGARGAGCVGWGGGERWGPLCRPVRRPAAPCLRMADEVPGAGLP